jgi:glycosyltransferase-like protein
MSGLRIALLAHSTNPRGGVVHTLGLADALVRLGNHVTVHAPDQAGRGFFRPTLAETVSVPASAVDAHDTASMVETRVADYLRYFEHADNRRFDIFHAQDGISGNALASLKARGLIPNFVRTVHHIDTFADPRVTVLQARAIREADRHVVVSEFWRETLAFDWGLDSTVVGNGVDTLRYVPHYDGREDALRAKLGLRGGPVFLSIGGVEERKNALGILEAFRQVHSLYPGAQLVIAGGVSLLDHEAYRKAFDTALSASGLPRDAVILAGRIADEDMPALYRIATTLLFPSLKEGFGLCVLEAMASGVPVVTSSIAPFTEYLGPDDVAWCDPASPSSIADATALTLSVPMRGRLIAKGHEVAARHDWSRTAEKHLAVYAGLLEFANA